MLISWVLCVSKPIFQPTLQHSKTSLDRKGLITSTCCDTVHKPRLCHTVREAKRNKFIFYDCGIFYYQWYCKYWIIDKHCLDIYFFTYCCLWSLGPTGPYFTVYLPYCTMTNWAKLQGLLNNTIIFSSPTAKKWHTAFSQFDSGLSFVIVFKPQKNLTSTRIVFNFRCFCDDRRNVTIFWWNVQNTIQYASKYKILQNIMQY